MRTDKAHAISVRSHNQCHHKVKFIHQISCWYILLQYNLQWCQLWYIIERFLTNKWYRVVFHQSEI